MALVDAEYQFIWASVGAPGNAHGSTLLQSTDLWKRIVGREMILNVVQQGEGGAFPLRTFMLEPHGDAIQADILIIEIFAKE